MLAAINFHYIRPTFDFPYEGVHGITPDIFESQLKTLSNLGEFIGAKEITEALTNNTPLPDQALVITFDDGLKEQFEYALPVLDKLKVPAIFYPNTRPIAEDKVLSVHKIHLIRATKGDLWFSQIILKVAQKLQINTSVLSDSTAKIPHYRYDSPEVARLKYFLNFTLSPQDKEALSEACFQEAFPDQEREIAKNLYMNKQMLTEIARNHTIGTHTHSHFSLGSMQQEEMEKDILCSVEHLSSWLGHKPTTLSYPFGSKTACPENAAQFAKKIGMDFSFTSERAVNKDLKNPMHLSRFDCNDVPGGKSWNGNKESFWNAAPFRQWYLS